MAVLRALACAAIATASLVAALPAAADSTDDCAQRVIRDWYDGGRVDGVYPLRCYRAAIRALPEDVLQYSDARNEIERALAYATQGKPEPQAPQTAAPGARPPVQRSELAARSAPPEPAQPKAKPVPVPTKPKPKPAAGSSAATPRTFDDPVQLAAPDDLRATEAQGLPYPVIVLGTLAALLVATAAAARVMTRRRGS